VAIRFKEGKIYRLANDKAGMDRCGLLSCNAGKKIKYIGDLSGSYSKILFTYLDFPNDGPYWVTEDLVEEFNNQLTFWEED